MTRLHWGDLAPDFELTNHHGRPMSLASLRGSNVLVYFFPKAFSPGCTAEVCDFRDHSAALADAGFVVLGVSDDPPERLAEFARANAVEHDLLSDPGCRVARRWGAYGEKWLDGQVVTGPIRSTFALDPDGLVQSVQYHVDPVGHAAAVLEALPDSHSTSGRRRS